MNKFVTALDSAIAEVIAARHTPSTIVLGWRQFGELQRYCNQFMRTENDPPKIAQYMGVPVIMVPLESKFMIRYTEGLIGHT